MEEVHQPVSNLPYMEPGLASVSQPTAVFPTNQQHQQNQQTPPSLRPLNSQSNEQPSIICGFTLTELAHVTIQVAGIIIAAVFGAWAVKSYESANIANRLSEDSLLQSNAANRLAQDAIQQSLYANILAIINLCLSSEQVSLFPWRSAVLAGTDVRNLQQFRNSIDCSAMLQDTRFASIIHDVISSLPTLSNTTQTVSKSSTLLPPPSPTTTKLPSITATLSTKIDLPPTMTGPPPATSSTITTLSSTTTTPPLTITTPPPPPPPTTATLPSTTTYPPLTITLSHTSTTISVAPTYSTPTGSPLHQISFGAVVGIIIAVVITVAIVCLLLIRSRRAKRSRF